MRIISGTYKARRISVPKNITARPTTDFAKEGLFNLIDNQIDIEGITALDLFAGTGSIGIELISRGANHVVSVEQSDRHCAFIRKTCKQLSIHNLLLLKTDVYRFLSTSTRRFDLIFADPPYDMDDFEKLPQLILDKKILLPNGLMIIEHSSKLSFETHPCFCSHRRYGNVNFSFFQYIPNPDNHI